MGDFFDHPNKIIIRDCWCKPIIKYLHENLQYKLAYLGLPGLEAIDLLSWIEYIKYVIAIDCGHYSSEGFNLALAQEKIKRLNTILSNLERKQLISGYSLYLGYIEEIILKGLDKNGQNFSLKDTINIYNLDFCNSLTVPLNIVDLKGNISKYYKNEVIRKLLEFERDIDKPISDKRFIMFITVHTNFWENEAEKYFDNTKDSYFEEYKVFIKNLQKQDRIVRLLRYYFLDILRQHFTASGFIPSFYPTILYEGIGENKLMCFTILGTYYKQASAIAPFYQEIQRLIRERFLYPKNQEIISLNCFSKEIDLISDPIKQFESFPAISKLWKKI